MTDKKTCKSTGSADTQYLTCHKGGHQPLHLCVLKGEKTIGKKYIAKGKNSLIKDKNVSAPYRGKGKVFEVATMADFAKLIESLGNRYCLTMGLPIEGRTNFRFTTKGKWQESMLDQDPPTITRTTNYFCWPDVPGFILLEHDPGHWDGEPITFPEQMLTHLTDVFPLGDWDKLGYVWYSSSSSCLYASDGTQISGVKGSHLFIPVRSMKFMKHITEALLGRLWLTGKGNIVIGEAGSSLVRSIFDMAPLKQPNFIAFPGLAVLPSGFKQKREIKHHEGEWLDLRQIKGLTPTEIGRYESLVKNAKDDKRDEAESQRRRYKVKETARLTEENNLTEEEARAVVTARFSGDLLASDFLYFDELGKTQIADVLKAPAKFHEMTLSDPLEGDSGPNNKAIIYCDGGGLPRVFCNTHGGGIYFLKYDFAAVLDLIKTSGTETVQADWPGWFRYLSALPHQEDSLLKEINKSTGLQMGGLRDSVKSIRRERNQERNVAKTKMLPDGPLGRLAFIESSNRFVDLRSLSSRGELLTPSVEAVRNYYKDQVDDMAQVLLSNPSFSRVHGLTYAPGGEEIIGGRLNLWRPSDLVPAPGEDVAPWLNLLERVIPDEKEREYLIQRLAFDIQHPDRKVNHHLLLFSKTQGVGKDTLIHPYVRAIGDWNVSHVPGDENSLRFNGYLMHSKVVIYQETDIANKRRSYNHWKQFAAAPPEYIAVNEKHLPIVNIPNLHSYIFMSNIFDSIALERADRRLSCIHCTEERLDKREAREIWQWYHRGGIEAVAGFLLNVDLSSFDPKGHALITEYKQEMQEHALTECDLAVRRWIEEKFVSQERSICRIEDVVFSINVLRSLKFSEKAVGRSLRNWDIHRTTNKTIDKKRITFWVQDEFLLELTGRELLSIYDTERKQEQKTIDAEFDDQGSGDEEDRSYLD